ncbi:MAG: VCBS repeat-containing protein [Bryobacteraceae bacterium]|nr:VCBS repeat-containing protein [Bryobacteraceae bacterium]
MKPILLLSLAAASLVIARSPEMLFERTLVDPGISETAAIGDFNGDGRLDIFSGDAWYENPTWKKHVVREIKEYGTYLETLSDLALDVDGDGHVDIVSSGWHPKRLWWSRNPGKAGVKWQDATIDDGYPVEFSFLVDMDNDGKAAEVLPQYGSKEAPTAWYRFEKGAFRKCVASNRSYGHGIGAGDVNGDGRTDIVTPEGWLEAPADPCAGEWKFHPEYKLDATSFIFVIDLNEDGLPDLLSGHGHNYGVFWMEQRRDRTWVKHVIDDSWSQPHALTLVDLNGDGRKDLLTGKRFMAHDGKDPGEREPLGLYWYEYRPGSGGQVSWSRHIIDYGGRAGGGMHLPVADMDGDGDLDFAAGGKSGLFYFENRTKTASKERKAR